MAPSGDVAPPAVEQQTPVVAPVEKKKPKTPKEKKSKSAKASNPSHPPYFQMIKEALIALKEKGGSSPYAIAKYLEDKHKAVLPANFKKILGVQLKNGVAKGKLVKVKASYKLSESAKKDKAVKKPVMKSTKKAAKAPKATPGKVVKAVKKVEKSEKPKKAAKKKVVAKKVKKAVVPGKRKQPKSIKSPAAKKAKKSA